MPRLEIAALDDETTRLLEEEALRRQLSPPELAATLIRESLRPRKRRNARHLAGTWSEEEAREFAQAIAPFEQVDPDLWRESSD